MFYMPKKAFWFRTVPRFSNIELFTAVSVATLWLYILLTFTGSGSELDFQLPGREIFFVIVEVMKYVWTSSLVTTFMLTWRGNNASSSLELLVSLVGQS